jgi:glycosyltransferase involved in cell wall biosynthesis
MKIAHVVCVIPPYGGGLGRVADAYARGLTELGHQVTVFVPTTDSGQTEEKPYAMIYLKPWFRLGLGAFMPQLLWHLRGFDVIHLHFPFFGGVFPTIVFKLLHPKIHLFVTYHQDLKFKGWREWFYRLSRWLVVPLLCRLAERVIVSSTDYAGHSYIAPLTKRYPQKFVALPFGVYEIFSPRPKDHVLQTSLHIPTDHFVLMFVGGLNSAHYFKGVTYLIDALTLLRDKKVSAIIVGSGNLQSSYEQHAQTQGIADRVHFTGFVADSLLPQYVNLADVLVLPSTEKNEAFGLVLIEAMACGKPVIASNLPGVRSVVRDGVNGWLCEPKDAESLARAITKLIDNPQQYQQFSATSVALVAEHYRWPRIIKLLEQIYKTTL